MCEDVKRYLIEKKLHSQEFIRRATKAYNLIPYVQKGLEYTEFELGVINNCPEEVKQDFDSKSAYYQEDALDFINRLILPPEYSDGTHIVPSPSSAALTMSVVKGIEQYCPTATAITWMTESKSAYASIIENSTTKDFIKKGIEKLNYELIIIFEDAEDDFDKYKAEAIDAKKVALSMRTLIHRFNGEIIEKARKWREEGIRLKEAFERITVLSKESNNYQQLMTRADGFKSGLNKDISDIVHDRNCQKNLEEVHVDYIEFLNIALSAIFC